jgi:lysophospholipase L1-like esterase
MAFEHFWRRLAIGAALAMALLATGMEWANAQATPTALPTELQGVHRVVCLGDSITQFGEGPGGYVWLVRHYLADLYPGQAIEVDNAGISGNTSQDMINRFQKDVLDKKPDLVTISVGVNDVWHEFYDNHPLGDGPQGVPLDKFRSNVDSMMTQAQAAGAKVVILSTTVIYEDPNSGENKKARSYNKALSDIAKAHHAIFVDYQKPFWTIINGYRDQTGGRDNLLTVDGVHMNAEGNKVMAHTLLSGLGISPDAQQTAQDQVAKEENVTRSAG